jgi:hypothetical protein
MQDGTVLFPAPEAPKSERASLVQFERDIDFDLAPLLNDVHFKHGGYSGGNRIGMNRIACQISHSRALQRAMYTATGVPTATIMSIAYAVSTRDTRTEDNKGPRTSSSHCHEPTWAKIAVMG